ncbi:hypothetical protein TPA0907_57080 [Micromonospora humidisoli]|uniref:non-specific serine/threonine protein kinase n=1 Tax=Micromonospora humidisoli TaxID=2807622 RepID=A0ABS2JJF3_9ACTN|nr:MULTISPECIES: serine/threonine-protein kinase [Micromonospora]MBM7086648.1 serine/threonine protein kinase [Micromonospora humidisoli]GHJ11341.1 hypothetical protein TPA0907_57080 [Micromonospora sp. AKA109]
MPTRDDDGSMPRPGSDRATGPDRLTALQAIRRSARQQRRDFALDPRPIAVGGQAQVFRARHKPTSLPVAFKKLRGRSADDVARMKREIEAADRFSENPNVLPVLDWSPTHDWFVMPLADATAHDRAGELRDSVALRALIESVCSGLREPHRLGWIHRDLKPENILWYDGRWVVADWGLGRRPRGETTNPGRTRAGRSLGTEGYAAPELGVDAHMVLPAADVYSIGQIIGWAVTGSVPRQNVPLVPPSGPWRSIVRAATQADPDRRLPTIDDLLAMIAAEFDTPTETSARGRRLVAAVRTGERAALVDLVRLAARSDLDDDLLRDILVALDGERTRIAVSGCPNEVGELVHSIHQRYPASTAARPEAGDPGPAVRWLLSVAEHAEDLDLWELFETTSDGILHLAASGRLDPDDDRRIVGWLSGRSGDAAGAVAGVLRRARPVPWLTALADVPALDRRVKMAVSSHMRAGGTGPDRLAGGTGPDRLAGPPVPEASNKPGSRRRTRWILTVAALSTLASAGVIVGVVLNGQGSKGGAGNSDAGDSVVGGLPDRPSELARFDLAEFVDGWDSYPSWSRCVTGTGSFALTGSFPARPSEVGLPTQSVHCTNGASLNAMFAEYRPGTYNDVSRVYLTAPPPEQPVRGEIEPPPGLHVFAWSATERALVWTDAESGLIGVIVTDSPGTDLVKLWNTYQPA